MSQIAIATKLGFSRPKISRLLSEAKRQGIVNITLNRPDRSSSDLARLIELQYSLEEAIIVSVDKPENNSTVVNALAPAAANNIIRRLTGKEIIGITWGKTISAVIDAMPGRDWPDLTIVQINGGLGPSGALEHSTAIATRIAGKLSAKLQLLPAPGIASNPTAAKAFKSDRQVSATLDLAQRADVAIVGMGVLSDDSVLIRDGSIVTARDVRELEQAGAVGDIALRYIDKAGRTLKSPINNRIIGLTLQQLKKIPCVIAVAGGMEKLEIIRAGLASGIVNVLVTSQSVAEQLKNDGKEKRV